MYALNRPPGGNDFQGIRNVLVNEGDGDRNRSIGQEIDHEQQASNEYDGKGQESRSNKHKDADTRPRLRPHTPHEIQRFLEVAEDVRGAPEHHTQTYQGGDGK